MSLQRRLTLIVASVAVASLAACGKTGPSGTAQSTKANQEERRETIWDILRPNNTDIQVAVNRYLWNASLEVLNFLPVQSVDPFTGVIVMGYGTPPGGGKAYRATVYVKDPALEARSLVVAMQTRGGRPVSASTQRAVEDAILARARQLRIQDGKL